MKYILKSIFLLSLAVGICCIIYPLTLWVIGQMAFPFEANGSMIAKADGKFVGSKLIAQPFTRDEYFHPRPSAASYNAAASASSSLAASNYALRDRVASSLGTIVTYKTGAPVALDVERWFESKPHLLVQWVTQHPGSARDWIKAHPSIQVQGDEGVLNFFQSFSEKNPGKFPFPSEISSLFFDMWRQEHPAVELVEVPADSVMSSASGLDPHITLENAKFQLKRVASKWASLSKRNPIEVTIEIEDLLTKSASAPLKGLAGEPLINVLEINLELEKRYNKALQ